jgi:hypothetical protein
MQAAMVTSFGLWFGSYAESLCDDLHIWPVQLPWLMLPAGDRGRVWHIIAC